MADNVNHPAHYQPLFQLKPLECNDIKKYLPASWSDAFKYVWRAGKKGGKDKMIEDLRKARWYIRHAYVKSEVSEIAVVLFFMILPPIPHKHPRLWRRYSILGRIVSLDVSAATMIREWLEELGDTSDDRLDDVLFYDGEDEPDYFGGEQ